MAYADKCYVGKRVKLELLSQDDVRQIHEATLDVIENVGVKFHSQNALDILEANGATVDRETTVAKIPAAVVERAMSTAPHEYTLGARNPEYDLPLDGEHIYISSDGCGVFDRDPVTGEVRSSRKQDLADCAKVVQALDNVSATSAVVSAQDCPPETRVLHEFDACVRNSREAQHRRLHQGGLGGAQPHQDGRGDGRRQGRAEGAARCSRPSSAP